VADQRNDAIERGPAARQRGVVLLALLLALALGGIATMAAVDVWALTRQRAAEEELLFVGDQYRKAILHYYLGAPPGTRRVLPATLEDLLDDNRNLVPVHHLRRLYPDPITGSTEWGALRIGDRIAGVYSLSDREPIKKARFAPSNQQFTDKTTYRDWVFVVSIPGRGPISVTPPSGGNPADGIPPTVPLPPALRTRS
jgi:type II secretory pathway pseudopilin PulG